MSEQANIRAVRAVYEALNRGDHAGILNALHDDVEWHAHGPEHIPFTGRWFGRDRVVEYFNAVVETTTRDEGALDPETFEFIAQGDQVVVLGHDRVHVRSTQRPVETWWVHVFTLRDGQITRFRQFFDTAKCAEAFAAGPEEPSGIAG